MEDESISCTGSWKPSQQWRASQMPQGCRGHSYTVLWPGQYLGTVRKKVCEWVREEAREQGEVKEAMSCAGSGERH